MADNKRYYWLKLNEDFFEDDTITWLEEQENGKDYVIFYLKLALKSIKDNGRLIRYVGERLIPYDVKALAKLTNTPVDTVVVAMKVFLEIGLIDRLETGEIYMTQIEEMVGTETQAAQRMRRLRARENETKLIEKDGLGRNNVQDCYKDVQISHTEKELEKELDIDKEIKREIKKKEPVVYDPDESLNQTILDFIDFRKKIRATMTDRAVTLLINNLNKLASDNEEKIKILEQSIMNGWKGIFPLKEEKKQSTGYSAMDLLKEGYFDEE